MFILVLYRLLFGWVRLRASGDFPERIINVCSHNGITLWDIKNVGGGIEFSTEVRSFRKLRVLRRRCGVRLHITKRRGLPFLLHKYRKRMGFIVGLILFFAIINVMSMFAWNICVVGNQRISTAQILSVCESMGIKEGAYLKNINVQDKRVEMQMKMDDLSWVAFNIEGSKITVEVSESKDNGKKLDKNPCNLKATADGVVKKIEVKSGKIMVKVGDAVMKGDMLVSGTVDMKSGMTKFEHSDGSVIAETERTFKTELPLKITEDVPTGKVRSQSVLKFFGLKIPLYLGSIHGEYNRDVKEYRLAMDGSYVPVTIVKANFHEIKKRTRIMGKEEAAKKARSVIENQIKNTLKSAKILNSDENVEFTDNSVIITKKIVCDEDIATKEILLISTRN